MTSFCDFCTGPHDQGSCHLLLEVDRGILCAGIPHDDPRIATCDHHAQVKQKLQAMTKASSSESATSAFQFEKIKIFDDSITTATALLPVCTACTATAFNGQSIPAGLDGCKCATLIVENNICSYCEVQRIANAKYQAQGTRMKLTLHQGGECVELKCQCGNPVTAPEMARKCVGCDGIVARPFHNFNGDEVDFEFATVNPKAPGAVTETSAPQFSSNGTNVAAMVNNSLSNGTAPQHQVSAGSSNGGANSQPIPVNQPSNNDIGATQDNLAGLTAEELEYMMHSSADEFLNSPVGNLNPLHTHSSNIESSMSSSMSNSPGELPTTATSVSGGSNGGMMTPNDIGGSVTVPVRDSSTPTPAPRAGNASNSFPPVPNGRIVPSNGMPGSGTAHTPHHQQAFHNPFANRQSYQEKYLEAHGLMRRPQNGARGANNGMPAPSSQFAPQNQYGGPMPGMANPQQQFIVPSQGLTPASPYLPNGMLTGGATTGRHNSNSQQHAFENVATTPARGADQAPAPAHVQRALQDHYQSQFSRQASSGATNPGTFGRGGAQTYGGGSASGTQIPAGMPGGEFNLQSLGGMLPSGAMDGMRSGISQPHAFETAPTTPMHAPNYTPTQYFGGGASGTPAYSSNSITPQAQFPKHISQPPQGRPPSSSSPLAPQHQQHNRVQKQRGRPRKELGGSLQHGGRQQHTNTPQKSPLFTNDQVRLLHAWGLVAPTFPLPTSAPNPIQWTHKQKIDAVLCTNAARYIPLEKLRSLMDLCGFPGKNKGWADALRELEKMEVDVVEVGAGAGGQGGMRTRVKKVGCAEVLSVFEKNGWIDHVDIEGM